MTKKVLDVKLCCSDLLRRHIRLSSKCKAAPNEEQDHPSKAANPEPDRVQSIRALDSVATAASDLRDGVYESLGPSLTAIASREELERLYFLHFHPHWSLLDEDSFRNMPQIPELVAAVLVAGLWMIPTRDARLEARSQHDILMQEVTKRLVCTHWTRSTGWTPRSWHGYDPAQRATPQYRLDTSVGAMSTVFSSTSDTAGSLYLQRGWWTFPQYGHE